MFGLYFKMLYIPSYCPPDPLCLAVCDYAMAEQSTMVADLGQKVLKV